MCRNPCLLSACLLFLLAPLTASALVPMDDAELDDVRGRSGMALAIGDLKVFIYDDGVSIEDTETANRLNFYDMRTFLNFNTRIPFTLRVYRNQWDYAMIALEAIRWDDLEDEIDMPALDMKLRADVMNFSFYDATLDTTSDLGSLHMTGFSASEFALYAAPLSTMQINATTGLGFQLETRLEIEEFRWIYNEDADELRIGGLHLAGSFDDNVSDDPTEPDTWIPDGRFSIGRMDPRDEAVAAIDPAPATFHVVRDTADLPHTRPMLRFQLPDTQGSIRIAETEVGGVNFGPIIIDGLHAHHLQVDLVPWKP